MLLYIISEGEEMKKLFCKYILAITLAIISIGYGVETHVEATTSLKDLHLSGTHASDIMEMYELGIVEGRTSTLFKPRENATRGEIALYIANALGINTENVKNPRFSDLPTSSKYYHAVAALTELGVINGIKMDDGTYQFKAHEAVQRVHMVKLITLGFDLEVATKLNHPFEDITIYNRETQLYVQTLYDLGIAKGSSATAYNPKAPVRRMELATFLSRAVKNANDNFELISVE